MAVCAAMCQVGVANLPVAHAEPIHITLHLPMQNPTRTILGAPQTQYLKDQLSAGQGAQTWKVLGQQVCFQLLATLQTWQWTMQASVVQFVQFVHTIS